MTSNPFSLRENASIREALSLLLERGISAAPVVDEKGRPVGVLSATDVVIHYREKTEQRYAAPEYYQRADLQQPAGEKAPYERLQVDRIDPALVQDLMTPAVFSVGPDTSASIVVERMVALRVHHLFVAEDGGRLVGVISALDVLSNLAT